eukprot:TRINITY_DN15048_c0_g1_i1.p1 TRINITY_DN15048_c0_g1~~TRINITY_DN15048_c0_g1_i1.p1  ORF type:complete len:442 (-),score=70.81 TRINITY_DN15048_c0_g1_i1:36-1361(-)
MVYQRSRLFIFFFSFSFVLAFVSSDTSRSPNLSVIINFDRNGDTALDLHELENLYSKIFPNAPHEDDPHVSNGTFPCYSPRQLFLTYDKNQDSLLSNDELGSMNDMIVWMLASDCFREKSHRTTPKCVVDMTEAWTYGLLCSCIVSLASLAGVFLIPIKGRMRNIVLELMVSFAIGAIVGDSILHLIPAVFGVHSHGGDDADSHDSHDGDVPSFIWPAVVVCLSILGFFILEKCINLFYWMKEKGSRNSDKDKWSEDDDGDGNGNKETIEVAMENLESNLNKKHSHSHIKPVGWLNLFADGFHNFTDGLAIGVSFATGNSMGLATAIAVFFHEVPQELGDFAILLHAGFSKRDALLFNFLSATIAIVGTVIGLSLGEDASKSEKWLLAIVTGGFLYIGLADMLPEIADKFQPRNIIRQTIAILSGMGMMLFISFFEPEKSC